METNSALQNYAAELIPAYNGRKGHQKSEWTENIRSKEADEEDLWSEFSSLCRITPHPTRQRMDWNDSAFIFSS